jgi:hypothetical protein
MKFLTIGTFKDVRYTLPQAEQKKQGVLQYEYNVEMKKKMGDRMHFYTVPGWDRMIVIIWEVSSVEELAQMIGGAPVVAAGFLKYESYPLIEADVKSFEATLASLKAAK